MSNITETRKTTMSSREIAEVVESRHEEVKRSMARLANRGLITFTPMAEKSTGGRPGVTYHVNKRDSYVVVAQLSPEFTARLVDRWQELEQQVAQPAFEVPTTLSGALRLAADQADQIEQQQREIEQARPAVEFVGRYVEAGTTKSIRETAKILGVPEKAFIKAMIDDKILYRQSGNLLPHQKHHAAERFDVKTGERNGHAYTQTRVTSVGVDYLARVYGHWIGEADS